MSNNSETVKMTVDLGDTVPIYSNLFEESALDMAQARNLSGRPETPDLRIDDNLSMFSYFSTRATARERRA